MFGRHERGAAAVEFALVVPILLALILGMMIFGRAYQVQSSLSMAAREGARIMALDPDHVAATAEAAAVTAASNLGVPGAVTATATACSGSPEITTVTVSHTFDFLGVTLPLSGKGVMRCGG